eukprot:Opistho-2@43808
MEAQIRRSNIRCMLAVASTQQQTACLCAPFRTGQSLALARSTCLSPQTQAAPTFQTMPWSSMVCSSSRWTTQRLQVTTTSPRGTRMSYAFPATSASCHPTVKPAWSPMHLPSGSPNSFQKCREYAATGQCARLECIPESRRRSPIAPRVAVSAMPSKCLPPLSRSPTPPSAQSSHRAFLALVRGVCHWRVPLMTLPVPLLRPPLGSAHLPTQMGCLRLQTPPTIQVQLCRVCVAQHRFCAFSILEKAARDLEACAMTATSPSGTPQCVSGRPPFKSTKNPRKGSVRKCVCSTSECALVDGRHRLYIKRC